MFSKVTRDRGKNHSTPQISTKTGYDLFFFEIFKIHPRIYNA